MLNFISPINNQTGYGITGYNLFNNLSKIDRISLMPIGPLSIDPLWNKDIIADSIANTLEYDHTAPCFKCSSMDDLLLRPVGKSKYGALTFFETNRLKKIEKTNINNIDTVFVASSWAKNVLLENGIKTKISICKQGVDTSIFDYNQYPQRQNSNTYRFLNIGKWEIRKGHDILVELFNKAFDHSDNVELIMMNHNPFLNDISTKKWIDKYKNSKLGDKIQILPRVASQQILANIISMCDCGIFPARAEGWNNEAIEMMAMNKPIIITNYSAHTEYCTNENSFLVDIEKLESAVDDIWFFGDGEWASITTNTMDSFIDKMRYVFKNKISTNPYGVLTASGHPWSTVTNIIYEELNE